MSKVYDELGGALLIMDRRRCHHAVVVLVEGCRSLNGDFIVSDGAELSSASQSLAYLFENLEVEGHLGWSCDNGYVGLEFESDGSLMIVWSGYGLQVEEAIIVIEEIARKTSADRGYVWFGGWLPASLEEFRTGFEGETLYRFVHEPPGYVGP